MSVFVERVPIFPWSPDQLSDRQFSRLLRVMLLLFLLIALVVPLLPLPPTELPPEPEPPAQLTRLLIEKKVVKPPPAIINKPKPIKPKPNVVKKKPVAKKVPKPAPVKKAKAPVKKQQSAVQARKKAASSGLLALQRQLVSMRESADQSQVGRKVLSKKGSQSLGAKPAIKASSARSSSGGIDSTLLSDASKSSGLNGRGSSKVTSSIGGQSATGGSSSGGGVATRSIEEIRKVFDANKGAIFAIYNRALRKNPDLAGKVLLELVIEPSGAVSLCRVVTSELADAGMERKLASRVRMFQFLEKSVSVTRIKYPVDFLPS